MKTHSIIGANILAHSKSKILKVAEQIALYHHEKWNGKGYPQGLSGENIPLVGRIIALADVFDALTSRRPYKDPFPVKVACDIIKKERGEHFDPSIVDVFLGNIDEIVKIKEEIGLKEHLSLADPPKGKGYQLEG
ncbi:HD domain-containing protein, partial [bacterium]|nr:HD domain-containing protein [bacterium]